MYPFHIHFIHYVKTELLNWTSCVFCGLYSDKLFIYKRQGKDMSNLLICRGKAPFLPKQTV